MITAPLDTEYDTKPFDEFNPADLSCIDVEYKPSSAPLRRLTEVEYRNTLRDLFVGVDVSPESIPLIADSDTTDFGNNVEAQAVSSLGTQRLVEGAIAVAQTASQNLGWAACQEDNLSCIQNIASTFATRAYRRPLTAAESTTFEAFVTEAYAAHGQVLAVEMLVSAILQSPYFIYRPEIAAPTGGEQSHRDLDAYELASRLSYMLWQTMPDAGLLAAAADGSLLSATGYVSQIERLLGDERARAGVSDFFEQWLGISELENVQLDPVFFPEFNTELREDLHASALAQIEKAFWEEDSIESLLGGSTAFVNDRLAPLFGVPATGSNTLIEIQLDPEQRRGILTHPAVLASTSHGATHSPVFRGLALMQKFLCLTTGAPPAGILDDVEEQTPEESCTTREYFENQHQGDTSCATCHTFIDGAGFLFENYEALGRYRTSENGCDIDASGGFPSGDLGREIANAVDLSARMVESEDVAKCFSTQLFRYAQGRLEGPAEVCEVESLASALTPSEGASMQALLIDLLNTPSFKSKPAGGTP